MEQKRLPSTTDQQLIISNRQIKRKKKPGKSEHLIGRQGRVEDPACSQLFEIVDGHRFEKKKQGKKSVSNGQQIIPFSRRRLRSLTVGDLSFLRARPPVSPFFSIKVMDGGVGVSSPLGATDHNARPGLPLRQTNPAGLCNSPAFASAVYRRAPAQRMLLSLLVFYESGPIPPSPRTYTDRPL